MRNEKYIRICIIKYLLVLSFAYSIIKLSKNSIKNIIQPKIKTIKNIILNEFEIEK